MRQALEEVIGRDIRVESRGGSLEIDVLDIFSSLTFMLLLTLSRMARMVMILSSKKWKGHQGGDCEHCIIIKCCEWY